MQARAGGERRKETARGNVAVTRFHALVSDTRNPAFGRRRLMFRLETNGVIENLPINRFHEITVEAMVARQFRQPREQLAFALRVVQRKSRVMLERGDLPDQLLTFGQGLDDTGI